MKEKHAKCSYCNTRKNKELKKTKKNLLKKNQRIFGALKKKIN